MKYSAKDHTFVICAYKKSEYLEECILSLKSQTVETTIIMATSTPNDLILSLSEKYSIPLFVNNNPSSIGSDWNFGLSKVRTSLATVAHQDDTYESKYAERMLEKFNLAKDPIIYFSASFELRDGIKIADNQILNIKRLLLKPLEIKSFQHSKFVRRRVLSLGCPICCPAVTFVMPKVGSSPFTDDFKSDIDWQQWEIQSRKKGAFVYEKEPLMCHRIHAGSTTSEIINDTGRTEEDYQMFKKFWPSFISKILIHFYSKSQNSNNL